MSQSDHTSKTESNDVDFKSIGSIKVTEIIDNPDGTATIHFDVADDFKENLVKAMGWEDWTDEVFNKMVLEALERQLARYKEEE